MSLVPQTHNLPLVAEYGSKVAEANMAETTILAEAKSKLGHRLVLVTVSEGYEIAGSALRLNPYRVWRVRQFIGGAWHGQAYGSLHSAQARFNELKAEG